MSWTIIVLLAVGTYVLKAVGPVVGGGERKLPQSLEVVVGLLPPALLAALIVVNTFEAGVALRPDARFWAVLAAGIAVLARAPFLVTIGVGMGVAALLRAAGWA